MPRCAEPKRGRVHWDYMLDEMQWMSKDFEQERREHRMWAKRVNSRIFSKEISKII